MYFFRMLGAFSLREDIPQIYTMYNAGVEHAESGPESPHDLEAS